MGLGPLTLVFGLLLGYRLGVHKVDVKWTTWSNHQLSGDSVTVPPPVLSVPTEIPGVSRSGLSRLQESVVRRVEDGVRRVPTVLVLEAYDPTQSLGQV